MASTIKRTDDATLISSLRILARDIQSDDGVANAAIAKAADRIAELVPTIKPLKWKKTQYADEFRCRVDCFEYTIWGVGYWDISLLHGGDVLALYRGTANTLDAAKKKCQSHFDTHAKAVLKACGVTT